MKKNVDLGKVQETSLLTLWARAAEARKPRPMLEDPAAVSIVNSLDYDFRKLAGAQANQVAVCLRTSIYDRWIRRFLAEHPAGTVVELGAGLSTRFDRLDNGRVRWFDMDLPDVVALREQLIADKERRTTVAGSLLEGDWVEAVKSASEGPYFFVSEAVLVYFTEQQVKDVLATIATNFPGAQFAFDTASQWTVERMRKQALMQHVSATFTWGCDDPKRIEPWGAGYRLEESRPLMQLEPDERKYLPVPLLAANWVMSKLSPQAQNATRLNRFRLG